MGGQLGRENDLQRLLHRCDLVSWILVCVPHGFMPLGSNRKIIQQVSWTLHLRHDDVVLIVVVV